MRLIIRDLMGRSKDRFVRDFEADPYLPYILVLAGVLAGIGFWHRIPNGATQDSLFRLIDPMAAVGMFASDPGLESLRQGITVDKTAGATFYLYGLVLIPVFVAALVTGQFDAFTGYDWSTHTSYRWLFWQETPEWIWTWSLLITRFVSIVFAVGCVYLTYRIGTAMRDRTTGRLAAVLVSLTWGFLMLAHEVGEDIPALFFLLLVVYCALRYAKTGDEAVFLAGCVCGGLAIAFKLTAAGSIALLGGGYLLRTRHVDGWRAALVRPRLVIGGAVLGVVTICIGIPDVFAGGPGELLHRIHRGATNKATVTGGVAAPSWWWMLRSYLGGLGVPLFVAGIGGVVASVARLRSRPTETDGIVLSLLVIVGHLTVYAPWEYIRIHHLLPTFPFLALLLAVTLARFHDRNHALARPLIAVLLVSSTAYAGVGSLHYASTPWDEATEWANTNIPENATMDVYAGTSMHAAIPHGMEIDRYDHVQLETAFKTGSGREQPPTRTEWMLDTPERCPEYIQLTYWPLVALDTPNHAGTSNRTEYVTDLLGGAYGYEVAAEFGSRPPLFGPEPRSQTSLEDLLRAGVYPWTVTYGDEQDLRDEQYTLILQRTGGCPIRNDSAV